MLILFNDLRFSRTSVRLGEWNTEADTDCEEYDDFCADPVLNIPIEELIPHENYNPNLEAPEDDIALIRLSKAVNFTDFVKPICLPTDETLRDLDINDARLIASGWGINETGNMPIKL